MDGDLTLQDYGDAIEGALCTYDTQNKEILKDIDAIKIIELLIDDHYFGDQQMDEIPPLIANGVKHIESAIKEDLRKVENEIIVKVLATIHFVAKRRAKMGRDYMKVIHEYVGERIDTNVRRVKGGSLLITDPTDEQIEHIALYHLDKLR